MSWTTLCRCGSSSQTACSGCRRSALTATARRRSGNPRSPRVCKAASARGLWRPTCEVRSCRRWSSRPRGATARSPTWVSTSCAVGATVWPTHPSRCPSFAPRTAWSPWSRGGCRTWATWRGAATRARPRCSCCRLWALAGTPKFPSMLETGVCRWDHIPLGIYARGHVGAATLWRALERMDAAWPEGEEDLLRAQQQLPAGRPRRRLHAKLLLRGGQRLGLRVHTAAC